MARSLNFSERKSFLPVLGLKPDQISTWQARTGSLFVDYFVRLWGYPVKYTGFQSVNPSNALP